MLSRRPLLVRIKYVAPVLAAFAAAGAAAYSGQAGPQSQPAKPGVAAPAMNLNLVVIDPAHGGPDNGATLGEHFFEKDVTLAVAGRLRAALAGHGFTVVSTRDSDPQQVLPADQRAALANRSHAVACLVVHATKSGSGVHLFASRLQSEPPVDSDDESAAHFVPIPWQSAQAGSVDQSLKVVDDLRAAFAAGSVRVTSGRASVALLDSIMCPAVAVEIAPPEAGTDATPIRDAAYQQKIVDAIVGGLITWRTQATPPPDTAASGQSAAPAQSTTNAKVTP